MNDKDTALAFPCISATVDAFFLKAILSLNVSSALPSASLPQERKIDTQKSGKPRS